MFSESTWAGSKGDVIACLVQGRERPGSQRRSVLLGKDAFREKESFVLSSRLPVPRRQMALLYGKGSPLVLEGRVKCHCLGMLQCWSFRQLAGGCQKCPGMGICSSDGTACLQQMFLCSL